MTIPAPIKKLTPEVKRWRRDLHQHPEVGYELPRTSKFVADKLKEFGLEKVETGLGQSGVVGMLRGNQGRRHAGGSIMIRADMDALPMQEESGVKHASKTPGKFHGCGHDGHTACLLGAAKHLAATRNFKGTVYFCFQPAEEGGAGAKAMMDDGLFEKYPVDAVYGAHNWPSMPVGFMGCSEGKMLAASQEFYVTLTGKGGHAARPHEAHDPVVAGSELVLALQSIVSRNTDPIETAVLSVTQFQAGTTTNVIPNSAKLAGTMRSFSNVTMKKMIAEVRRKAKAVGAAHQVTVEVTLDDKPYPALINSKREARFAAGVMKDLLGEQHCVINPPPAMGSEDFAYYLIKDARTGRKTPGCFVTFGNGVQGPMLHNPKYDFNDEAIPHMVAFWSRLTEKALPSG
ncbi:MAG: M20 aminoacylase family protein [Pseudomonadota bacterium]